MSGVGGPHGRVTGAMPALHQDGLHFQRDLLTPGACRDLSAELTPLLVPGGRAPFRSRHVRGVYGVLHDTRAVDALIEHPRVLLLLDRLLLPDCLLSQLEIVEVGAGAPTRLLATTNQCCPRPPLSVAASGRSMRERLPGRRGCQMRSTRWERS